MPGTALGKEQHRGTHSTQSCNSLKSGQSLLYTKQIIYLIYDQSLEINE